MLFIAVDVGCIECGEPTSILGIFTNKEKAIKVLREHEKRQEANWRGQHNFELHEIKEIDVEERIDY